MPLRPQGDGARRARPSRKAGEGPERQRDASEQQQSREESKSAHEEPRGAGHALRGGAAADDSPMGLTKYERVHVLSARALALAAGAEPLVQMPGCLDVLQIAQEELRRGVLRSRVVRTLPGGERSVHSLQELIR